VPATRRLLGFALGEHHDTERAIASVRMAAAVRGGSVTGVIFQSDRGSEYTAEAFGRACYGSDRSRSSGDWRGSAAGSGGSCSTGVGSAAAPAPARGLGRRGTTRPEPPPRPG